MSAYWICDRCNAIEPMSFRSNVGSHYASVAPGTPDGWLGVPPRNESEEREYPDRNVLCQNCAADYEDFMGEVIR